MQRFAVSKEQQRVWRNYLGDPDADTEMNASSSRFPACQRPTTRSWFSLSEAPGHTPMK